MLVRICLLLICATVLGAVWAALRDMPWVPNRAAVLARIENKQAIEARRRQILPEVFIDLPRLRELIDERAVIIDARDRESFEREHLAVDYEPPVLNINPEDDLNDHLDRLFQCAGLPIVLYCNSDTCPLSEELYVMLEDAGVTANSPVYIYRDGWAGIEKSDLPRTSGPDTWTGFDDGQPAAEDEQMYDDAPAESPADGGTADDAAVETSSPGRR